MVLLYSYNCKLNCRVSRQEGWTKYMQKVILGSKETPTHTDTEGFLQGDIPPWAQFLDMTESIALYLSPQVV